MVFISCRDSHYTFPSQALTSTPLETSRDISGIPKPWSSLATRSPGRRFLLLMLTSQRRRTLSLSRTAQVPPSHMQHLKQAQVKLQREFDGLWLHFLLGIYSPQPILKAFTLPSIFYFGTRDEEREKGLSCEKLQLRNLNVFWSIWDKAANSNEGGRSLFISPTTALYSYWL